MRVIPITLLISLLLGTVNASAQVPSLKIVVPERDELEVSFDRIRIAGHTEPANRVLIDAREVKVYPTGAFIGMVELHEGLNCIEIRAINSRNRETMKRVMVTRVPSIETLPESPLRISPSMMLPDVPQQLSAGDVLNVRFLGSPGGRGSFEIPGLEGRFPMAEAIPEDQDGLRGVYEGFYIVKGTEQTTGLVHVRFSLERANEAVSKDSPGTVDLSPEQWPKVGEVRVEEASLLAGLGAARLGGAELGFLPKGVRLEMTGRVGSLYRVRLSSTRDAWIDAEEVRILPQGTPLPRSLTGRVTVKVGDGFDEVHFGFQERLPYLFDSEAGSNNTLILDIFGATSNLTWITNTLETRQYESLSWHQVEKDCLRFRFALKDSFNWGFSGGYDEETGSLVVRLKHPPSLASPPDSPLKDLIVALDAGHGGRSKGALGSTESEEKEVNRKVVSVLEGLLRQKGAQVILTRKGDETIDQRDRYSRAMENRADLYISVHANSIGLASDAAEVHGTSTYYKHPCFRSLSVTIYEELLGLGLEPFGNVSSFNFYPLKRTEMPAVLAEIAFMSNPEEEAMMLKPDFQARVAKSILNGIERFLETARDERSR